MGLVLRRTSFNAGSVSMVLIVSGSPTLRISRPGLGVPSGRGHNVDTEPALMVPLSSSAARAPRRSLCTTDTIHVPQYIRNRGGFRCISHSSPDTRTSPPSHTGSWRAARSHHSQHSVTGREGGFGAATWVDLWPGAQGRRAFPRRRARRHRKLTPRRLQLFALKSIHLARMRLKSRRGPPIVGGLEPLRR